MLSTLIIAHCGWCISPRVWMCYEVHTTRLFLPFTNCFLSNCFLSNCFLSNCFLSNCSLSNCFLSNCFFSNCFFSNCFLSNCFLSNCFLSNCSLQNYSVPLPNCFFQITPSHYLPNISFPFQMHLAFPNLLLPSPY